MRTTTPTHLFQNQYPYSISLKQEYKQGEALIISVANEYLNTNWLAFGTEESERLFKSGKVHPGFVCLTGSGSSVNFKSDNFGVLVQCVLGWSRGLLLASRLPSYYNTCFLGVQSLKFRLKSWILPIVWKTPKFEGFDHESRPWSF